MAVLSQPPPTRCSRCGSAEHAARDCSQSKTQAARKRKKLDGVTVPGDVAEAMSAVAAGEGVSASALWERAARRLLGLPEPPRGQVLERGSRTS